MLERIQETAAFLKGKMHTPPPRTVIKKTVLIMKTLQQQ